MTAPGGIGLTRVTVATSQRRMDVALPADVVNGREPLLIIGAIAGG